MTRTIWSVVAVALCLAGCREPLADVEPAGVVPLGPFAAPPAPETEALAVWQTPTTVLNERQQMALEQVRENAARIFASAPPVEVLDEIELVFFGAAATHELAAYYRAAADAGGPEAAIRPRLAWLYHWLGLTTSALEQAEIAVAGRPDDAQAVFVRGFVAARAAQNDPTRLRAALVDLQRTLELDAVFVGPGGFSVEAVREEIARVSALIPAS